MAATQLDLSSPPVGGVKNIAEIKGLIRAKAAETPKGEWILGFGYDDTGLEDKRHPLASDIDEVAPEHPVLLRHVSGHLSACNGLALAKANYTKDTPDPVGGVIRRDEHGNPNGVLEEPPAREPVFRHIPAPTEADWMEGIKAACAAYTAKGVTTAQDGFTATGDWGALKRAHELGLLRNRVQILPGVSRMDINTFNTHVSGTQLTADGKISLGAAKLLADGSLQCYTGYLSNPYHKVIYDLPDGPMWRGYPMEPEQQFIEKVVGLHRQGWQLAIHGNGDDAIQMILHRLRRGAEALSPRRRPAHRHPLPDRARGSARPHQAAWRGALVLCGPHLFLGRPPLRNVPRPGPRRTHQPAPQRPEARYPVQQPQRHVRDSHRSSAFRLVCRQQAHQRRAHPRRKPDHPGHGCAAQRDLVGRLSGLRRTHQGQP